MIRFENNLINTTYCCSVMYRKLTTNLYITFIVNNILVRWGVIMTKSEKIKGIIDACITKMDDDERNTYQKIAEYAVELGYTPKQIKTAHGFSDALTFTKSKVNRTLLKIRPNFQNPPVNNQIHQAGKSQLVLSFFATPVYSEVFKFGVKHVIEAFGGKYTGCFGCGRCKDELEGYTYVYPDGKTIFRCARELIELPPISEEHVDEIKAMMKAQDDFWLKQAVSNSDEKN